LKPHYLTDTYARIPADTEILLTHTPPYEVLDTTRRGKNAGCDVLAARLEELQACRLHLFGHIHEAHGAVIETEEENGGGDVPTTARRVSVYLGTDKLSLSTLKIEWITTYSIKGEAAEESSRTDVSLSSLMHFWALYIFMNIQLVR
jgi:hypothetical protein